VERHTFSSPAPCRSASSTVCANRLNPFRHTFASPTTQSSCCRNACVHSERLQFSLHTCWCTAYSLPTPFSTPYNLLDFGFNFWTPRFRSKLENSYSTGAHQGKPFVLLSPRPPAGHGLTFHPPSTHSSRYGCIFPIAICSELMSSCEPI
jgi:hypothetical protein